MGIVPSSLPVWAYLVAGGGAFVVARAATAGAGTDTPAAAAPGTDPAAAAIAGATLGGAGGSLWDAFGGGGAPGFSGMGGGQFGYGSGDPTAGGDGSGGDVVPAPSPTPTPLPPTTTTGTPYLWATFAPGSIDTYGTGKLKTGASCSLVNGAFTTGGFSAEVHAQTRQACDGSGARSELVIWSGQHAGKVVRRSQAKSVVTKYR